LDKEFKMFLKHRGIEVPSSLFDLKFIESQSFSQYRDIEIEAARANLFGQVEGVDYLSKRFIMKKYLGLTEDELREKTNRCGKKKILIHLIQVLMLLAN